jgi:RNA polymerase sigma-70 factor (ECF subfamily)
MWAREAGLNSQEFDEKLRETIPHLLRYFARRVYFPEDASDCLSETLTIMWQKRARIPKDEDQARFWSYGIARGVLSNYRRGHMRRQRLSERLHNELVSDNAFEKVDVDEELTDAMQALKPADRELLILIVWDGLPVSAAGAILGLKPEAARARYSRTRKKLRHSLQSHNQPAR